MTSKVIEAVRGQNPSQKAKKASRSGFLKKVLIKVVQWPQKPLSGSNQIWTMTSDEQDTYTPSQKNWTLLSQEQHSYRDFAEGAFSWRPLALFLTFLRRLSCRTVPSRKGWNLFVRFVQIARAFLHWMTLTLLHDW